jgi:hypothetical protein
MLGVSKRGPEVGISRWVWIAEAIYSSISTFGKEDLVPTLCVETSLASPPFVETSSLNKFGTSRLF